MHYDNYRPEIAKLAKQADRLWFKSHPERRHRLRQVMPGEYPGAMKLVAVCQIFPGLRIRGPFTFAGSLPPGEAPEWVAKEVFETIARDPGGEKLGNVEAILAAIPGLKEELARAAEAKVADHSFPAHSQTDSAADA